MILCLLGVGPAAFAVLTGGCGYAQGELLYMLGVGRPGTVKAAFRLTEEPILILVDDPAEQVTWPSARAYLTDELGQELVRNRAAKKVIPPQTLDQLRGTMPEFNKRGCWEVGQAAGASQVLWVEVQEFFVDDEFSDVSDAAYWYAGVKVINAKEQENTARVRLWPESPSGTLVTASLAGPDVARLGSRDAVAKELAGVLARKIARLFYDHRLGDTGREVE